MKRLALGGALAVLVACAAAPASALPGEQLMMRTTCGKLGSDATICRQIVDDKHVSLNSKRSCLYAITLGFGGMPWAKLKHHAATLTCEEKLAAAGYPVAEFIAKLSGQLARR